MGSDKPKTHRPTTAVQKCKAHQARPTAAKRGYGAKWQKTRVAYLASHPLCVECEKAGRLTAATDVDHIKPHRGDMGLFWDRSNWQSLCGLCHKRKTGRGE